MRYEEEDYLQISGIQHFSFCRRQWALIHIEKAWKENLLTVEGSLLHARAHDDSYPEKRKDTLIVRALNVFSPTLGVSGQCDIIEFHQDPDGIGLRGYDGKWSIYPVEYKHGESKEILADQLQLCLQAMCLEEMLCCDIKEGALFYGKTRRREKVYFSEDLRNSVRDMLAEMHILYQKGYTPKVRISKHCKSCSLKNICVPELSSIRSVEKYMTDMLEGI